MKFFVLLTVLGLVSALPTDNFRLSKSTFNGVLPRNSALEQQLKDLLEDLREMMVPTLDPLNIRTLIIDEAVVPIPGLWVEIEDTRVSYLSTFVVDQLTLTRPLLSTRYRLGLDLAIPTIELDAGYYKLVVPVSGMDIFGEGKANIRIIEPRLSGQLVIAPRIGVLSLFIRIAECNLKFTLKGFEPQITGLLGADENTVAFVNTFLRILVPDLVRLYEDDISNAINTVVMDVGNELLADLNLLDIIGQ